MHVRISISLRILICKAKKGLHRDGLVKFVKSHSYAPQYISAYAPDCSYSIKKKVKCANVGNELLIQ